jgi:2-keto-3-deoxy-L-rhamnonate aldolase RhmA
MARPAPAIHNPLKRALARGDSVLGTFVFEYGSPAAPRILKAAGWDYILIDTEHASFGIEAVASMLHVSASVGLPALVRVPETQRSFLSRPLDAGALGLMIPRVESRAHAEEIVRFTKYPPLGDRGMAPATAHTGYRGVSGTQLIREANAELLLVMQIETRAGLDNLDAILSTPGLDVAFLGPFDLSTSLGIPGELSHPHLLEATRAFLRGCARHGVTPGIWAASLADATMWLRQGVRFLTYSADFVMVLEHSRQVLETLRSPRRRQKSAKRKGQRA